MERTISYFGGEESFICVFIRRVCAQGHLKERHLQDTFV